MTWATDHIFVAGGDFVTDHWREFQQQAGVSAVILVATTAPTWLLNPLPWAMLWLPVNEEAEYTLDHLRLGILFIDHTLAARRKLLFHAPSGVHRTRPLVAAHWLTQGKSLARVLREMEQRPWLPPYKGDVSLLEKFLEERGT
jgi:hypothetical protein